VPELAREFGTPLYVFDRATIVNACREYQRAFAEHYTASPVRFLYASKAYLSPLIARLMAEEGMGLDVVSGGELQVAQRANFPAERLSFHGNNKSREELRQALQAGVGRIVLDNCSELEELTRLARAAGVRQTIRPVRSNSANPAPNCISLSIRKPETARMNRTRTPGSVPESEKRPANCGMTCRRKKTRTPIADTIRKAG